MTNPPKPETIRKRRQRDAARRHLAHISLWVPERDLEHLYGVADRFDGDLVKAFSWAMRLVNEAKNFVPRDAKRRSILSE